MGKIKVLELFGGIGACTQALKNIGIDFEVTDYVEIDKYAVKSYNAMNGTNFEPQDITKWDKDIDVDLIMHGSPCQDFSIAGNQAGGDIGSGTRSSLMYETIRIVGKLRPKYVIWENVKNLLSKKHKHNFDAYIQTMEALGYKNYYKVLNAKNFGIPQNRERVFTISILNNSDYEFPKGEDLDKLPKDILEKDVEEKYYLSESNLNTYNRDFGSKGKKINLDEPVPTLTASMGIGGGNVPYFEFPEKRELNIKLKDVLEENVDEKYYLSDKMLNYVLDGNDVCVNSGFNKNINNQYINPNIARTISCRGAIDQRAGATNFVINGTNNEIKVGEYKEYLKVKNATKKGYLEAEEGDGIDISARMQYHRGTVQKGMVQTLDTQATKGVVDSELRIRKLTPKECWRLMGFNDEAFEKAQKVNSNTQLYKQAGNSIVVNVLEAILKKILKEE